MKGRAHGGLLLAVELDTFDYFKTVPLLLALKFNVDRHGRNIAILIG